jgi:ABC-type branched-subunit amino acid transport system ATPase component
MTAADATLVAEDICVSFGGVQALAGVSFSVPEQGALSLVGPNGAGKTTVLNVVSGLARPTSGRLAFGAEKIDLLRSPARVRSGLGIARTFQHTQLFDGMTLLDQLMCGGYARSGYGLPSALARMPRCIRSEKTLTSEAYEILSDLDMTEYALLPTSSIPGALRRLGDIGRALMCRPRLLLLDEVAAGLSDVEKTRLIEVIRRYRASGHFAVVLIEHDLDFVRALAEEVVVLVDGKVLAAGGTREVLARGDVLSAYIGE